ncbi:MAG: energy transducer TonB [Reyranellaceae bacterium]
MKRGNGIEQSSRRRLPRGRRRPFLLSALLASLALHLLLGVPIFIPGNLFAAKAPPPDPIPVEIVSLPPPPAAEPPAAEPPAPPPPPPPPQPTPPPPQRPVQLPPPEPPPPVTPQQIVIATRDVATPPQGNEQANAAAEKAAETPQPMPPPEPEAAKAEPEAAEPPPAPPPPEPEAAKAEEQAAEPPLAPPPPEPPPPEPPQAALPAPAPPKPEPPRPAPPKPAPAEAEPPPEREVTGAIALARPRARPREQITGAEHKMPPVVVRPQPPGRAGNSLMPSYPSAARANGLQGRVVLLVTLSVEGRPRRIDIARSSGYDQLDESAVRAVWLWRFYRTDSGPPTEATIEIPLDFRL